jgi:hypothetical protein
MRDILKLTSADLSEKIVIQQIKGQGKTYRFTTDQLIRLKMGGVSDTIVQALMATPKADTQPVSQLSSASVNGVRSPSDGNGVPPTTTVVIQNAALSKLANVNPSGATPTPDQSSTGYSNDPLIPHDSGIYAYSTDSKGVPQMVVLERAAYQGAKTGGVFTSAFTYGIAKVKTKAVIPGKQAGIRISGAKPVFFFYFEDKSAGLGRSYFGSVNVSNPNQFALVRLDVGKSFRSTMVGQFSMWGASAGTNEKTVVPFKSERIRAGLYRVEIADGIRPGEYCFIASAGVPSAGAYGAGASTASDLFDFGVDPD